MPAIPTRYRYRRVVADGIFMSDLPVVETTLERHDRTRLARQVAVHRLDAEVPLEAPDGVRTDEPVPLALGEAQAGLERRHRLRAERVRHPAPAGRQPRALVPPRAALRRAAALDRGTGAALETARAPPP